MTQVAALSGGVGGAKLCLGLQRVLTPSALTVIVNTGDDFEHLGLSISPDIDTALYTLAGLANPHLGWGRADETWHCMEELQRFGGQTWFKLGDRDLALHLERTRRLVTGESLQQITSSFAARCGLSTYIVPMSNDPVRTLLRTDAGTLPFQDYFVRQQCSPLVRSIHFEGANVARPSPGLESLLMTEALDAIVICPSNPFLSIDPILAIPRLRNALRTTSVPVVAVSPLIAGKAIKGPTDKLMRELHLEASPASIANHYADVIDGIVIDPVDAHLATDIRCAVHVTPTLMSTLEDKDRLAREVISFCDSLRTQICK